MVNILIYTIISIISSISMKELWILNDLFVQAAKRGAGTGKNY